MGADTLKLQGIFEKGYGIVPKLVMQDINLSIQAKAIYAYFCSYAGTGECCFPTRKKICYDLQISYDTFAKYLSQLIKRGYLKVQQIKEHGKFSHNVYTLSSSILPCPKISDTENVVHEELDTNNNNTKNNIKNNTNIYTPFIPLGENEGKQTKKEKNKKIKVNPSEEQELIEEYITHLPETADVKEKLFAVIKNRSHHKRVTTLEIVKFILAKLEKLSNGDYETKINILNKSIEYGYSTVYPLLSNYSTFGGDNKNIFENYNSAYDIEEYENSYNIWDEINSAFD